jgi:hypothetical protein
MQIYSDDSQPSFAISEIFFAKGAHRPIFNQQDHVGSIRT